MNGKSCWFPKKCNFNEVGCDDAFFSLECKVKRSLLHGWLILLLLSFMIIANVIFFIYCYDSNYQQRDVQDVERLSNGNTRIVHSDMWAIGERVGFYSPIPTTRVDETISEIDPNGNVVWGYHD